MMEDESEFSEENLRLLIKNIEYQKKKLVAVQNEVAEHIARICPEYYENLFNESDFQDNQMNLENDAIMDICVDKADIKDLLNFDLVILKCNTQIVNSWLWKEYQVVITMEELEVSLQILIKIKLSTYFARRRRRKTKYKLQKVEFSTPNKALLDCAEYLTKREKAGFLCIFMHQYLMMSKSRDEILAQYADTNLEVNNESEDALRITMDITAPPSRVVFLWNFIFCVKSQRFLHRLQGICSREVVQKVDSRSRDYLQDTVMVAEDEVEVINQVFSDVTEAFPVRD